MKDEPKIVELTKRTSEYNAELKRIGVRDHQVEQMTSIPKFEALGILSKRILILALILLSLIPGVFINLPVLVIVNYVASVKRAEALAASTVKVSARDVVATWKVRIFSFQVIVGAILIPVTYTLEALIATVYFYPRTRPFFFYSWFVFVILVAMLSFFTVYAFENFIDLTRSLPTFIYAVFGSNRWLTLLKVKRQVLKCEIAKLIEEKGATVEKDFVREEDREWKLNCYDEVQLGSGSLNIGSG